MPPLFHVPAFVLIPLRSSASLLHQHQQHHYCTSTIPGQGGQRQRPSVSPAEGARRAGRRVSCSRTPSGKSFCFLWAGGFLWGLPGPAGSLTSRLLRLQLLSAARSWAKLLVPHGRFNSRPDRLVFVLDRQLASACCDGHL